MLCQILSKSGMHEIGVFGETLGSLSDYIKLLIIARCMEHTIYLAAKAFIDKVKPQAPKNKKTTKNGTTSVEDVDDDDDDEVDDSNDDWLMDWIQLNEVPDDEEVDDIVDFEAGDVLGKALALVNQVFSFSFIPFPLLTHNRFVPLLKQSNTVHCVASQKVSPFLS